MNTTPRAGAIKQAAKSVSNAEWGADLFAFILTVLCAMIFKWQATGLVWGLWLSSLSYGYLTIILTLIERSNKLEGSQRIAGYLGSIPILAFFTVHFGMFHFVHGIFLTQFFPIENAQFELSTGFPNPFALVLDPLRNYWPMVLGTFISRFNDLPIIGNKKGGVLGMVGPYVGVVRMHILIFVFAGLNAIGVPGLAIYPVLVFYFFPWRAILSGLKS